MLAAVPDRRIFLDLFRLSQLTGAVIERHLSELGIPAYLFGLLSQIRRLEPVTPSAVSQATGIATTTLRDNIQRLVDRGLVRRTPNPSDGRSYLIELTDKGELLARAADPALLQAYLAVERRLPRASEEYEARLDELDKALAGILADPAWNAAHRGSSRGKDRGDRARSRRRV
jgi:DNA-binding MarR family transcriptional regulator